MLGDLFSSRQARVLMKSQLRLLVTLSCSLAAPGAFAQQVPDPVAELRQSVLSGSFGSMSAHQLVDATFHTQGSLLEATYLALAVRKQESFPIIKEKLRSGLPNEKRMMTKALRYLGWPEAVPNLVELVADDSEHPLARIGAAYALGAIGDKSAGQALIAVLDNPKRGPTERRVAIAAIARLDFRDAIPRIRAFEKDSDTLVRIYVVRALAELGVPQTTESLLGYLDSEDYVFRQEASGALGSVGGIEAVAKLKEISRNDPHGAVRAEARLALLRIEVKSLNQSDRSHRLEQLLQDKSKTVRSWVISELDTTCGQPGQAALQRTAMLDSLIGLKCRSHLLLTEGAGPNLHRGQSP